MAAEDSSLNQTIRARIREKMDAAEYRRVLEEYVKAARGIYDLSDTEGEDLAEEELLSDAYAGMNRFKAADATQYTETVRRSVQERTNRQTAKATENITGPTQRYSVSDDFKDKCSLNENATVYVRKNELNVVPRSSLLKSGTLTANIKFIGDSIAETGNAVKQSYSESEEEQEQKTEKLPRYAKREAEKIRYDMMREIGADIFRDMGPVKAAIDDMAREALWDGERSNIP